MVNMVAQHIQQSKLCKDPEFVAGIRWMMLRTVHTNRERKPISVKIQQSQKLTDESITTTASTAITDRLSANPTPDRMEGVESLRALEPPPTPDILSLQV